MAASAEHRSKPQPESLLSIALIGTRGVPAAYGGFETAVEEIGKRLVARGHKVTVFCRTGSDSGSAKTYLGMRLVHIPAIKSKYLETLSHTFLSLLYLFVHPRPDAALVFNAANSPFLPILRVKRVPVALHVDGLEWERGKWGKVGRGYYRFAEQLAVRWADSLIADADGIERYYSEEFGVRTELLSYGTKIQVDPPSHRLAELGLVKHGFHLVVARFEPENHVDVIVEGYARSQAKLPLVIVGSAPYAAEYTNRIKAVALGDPRILTVGGIWDQDLLDQLYANALTYVHGHSVGGTNPSLLRALGGGTSVLAWDVNFNREVVGNGDRFFMDRASVARLIEDAEADPSAEIDIGARLRERAALLYDWDEVATGYESLVRRLVSGQSTRGEASGSRQDHGFRTPSSRKPNHAR